MVRLARPAERREARGRPGPRGRACCEESPAMALDTSKPAMQTIGNYDLLEKIAEGGMGTVYKGRNRQTNQIVAVKIVPPNMANNAVFLKRFEQEFKAASKLDHPNIIRAL